MEKKEIKKTIQAYIDEGLLNLEVLYDLIQFAQDIYLIQGHKNIMSKIGYKVYDVAKPQGYIDYLNQAGVNKEITRNAVYDYTDKTFGELSLPAVKYVEYLRTNLINEFTPKS